MRGNTKSQKKSMKHMHKQLLVENIERLEKRLKDVEVDYNKNVKSQQG